MKVFISSVIHGYEEYREAAANGVEVLGYEVSRSEDFSARPDTPQQACLSEVRDSDVVILLLGERYGTKQESGLSATQEEYNEAKKSNKPVLVFIESDIEPELDQAEFIKKVEDWTSGHLINRFSDSKLKAQITKSLHYLALQQNNLVSEDNATERAKNLLSAYNVNYRPRLLFGLVVSPQKQIFRPSDLDRPSFRDKIQGCGKKGDFPILKKEQLSVEYRNNALTFEQSFGLLSINQQGDIYIAQDLSKNNLSHRDGFTNVIIEEQVASRLYSCLQFCRCILQTVDTIRDFSRFVVAVCIKDNKGTPWRTQKKHRESPSHMNPTYYQEMMPEALEPFTYYHLENDLDKICDDLVSIIKSKVHQG